jgi:hypothetical protein
MRKFVRHRIQIVDYVEALAFRQVRNQTKGLVMREATHRVGHPVTNQITGCINDPAEV